MIRWFKHGKWPKALVWLHHYTIVSFVLLMITGIMLYAPAIHTPLIPYLPAIYEIHIILGLVFAVSLITPLLRVIAARKAVWRLDWWFPLVFGAAIVITGLLLWRVTWFPTRWRSTAFTWHGDLSYVLTGWILIHAFYKTFGLRPRNDGIGGRVDPERRMFVRWLGVGAVGAAVIAVIDPFSALTRWFQASSAGSGSGGASDAFAAFYTVTGGYPKMQTANYQLRVEGAVANPLVLSWADVQNLPPYGETVDFHCVTGWSVPGVKWDGVHISELVKRVKPDPNVRYVNFYSFDGAYSESLTLQEAQHTSVLLAYRLNGKPLPVPQGYPLRLVVPKMYGYKSIKWLNRVEFSAHPITGFWEQRGYPNEAYI